MGDQVSLFEDAVVLIARWHGPPPRLLGYEWHRVRRLNAAQWLDEYGCIVQLPDLEP